MIPVMHNVAQEETPQELQGNKLTLVYEKLRVVLLDQLLDIRCRWPMLRLPHLAMPHCAPSLPSFLAMACAPSSYDKVSHVPATPSPPPCPCPCLVHAHTLSMPAPCPCPCLRRAGHGCHTPRTRWCQAMHTLRRTVGIACGLCLQSVG